METAKILIIDDDDEWREEGLRSPLLFMPGFQLDIKTEKDRLSAQALFSSERFDLVILNIRLEYPIAEAKITQRWLDLMYSIKELQLKVMVVTSKMYPPSIEFYKIMQIAYTDYEVDGFWIKEEFDPGKYRSKVQKVLKESTIHKLEPSSNPLESISFYPNNGRSLDHYEKQFLIKRLSKENEWQIESAFYRKNVLLLVGLPIHLVDGLELSGHPEVTAAIVVHKVLDNGNFLIDPENYTCLGLLIKYLYGKCIETTIQRDYVKLIGKYQAIMTTDQVWLNLIQNETNPFIHGIGDGK